MKWWWCWHKSFFFKVFLPILMNKHPNRWIVWEVKTTNLVSGPYLPANLKADMHSHTLENVTVFLLCVAYHGSLVPVLVFLPTLHPDSHSLAPEGILVWSQGRWGHIVCTLWWQDATAQPVLLCPLVCSMWVCALCVSKGRMGTCFLRWENNAVRLCGEATQY